MHRLRVGLTESEDGAKHDRVRVELGEREPEVRILLERVGHTLVISDCMCARYWWLVSFRAPAKKFAAAKAAREARARQTHTS